MKTLDLSTLIKETQDKQKKYLSEFKEYINSSTELKKNVTHHPTDDKLFIEKILRCFFEGISSQARVPENTDLSSMLSILLNNKAYINELDTIVLPESGTADDRFEALINYLNSHLKVNNHQGK